MNTHMTAKAIMKMKTANASFFDQGEGMLLSCFLGSKAFIIDLLLNTWAGFHFHLGMTALLPDDFWLKFIGGGGDPVVVVLPVNADQKAEPSDDCSPWSLVPRTDSFDILRMKVLQQV